MLISYEIRSTVTGALLEASYFKWTAERSLKEWIKNGVDVFIKERRVT